MIAVLGVSHKDVDLACGLIRWMNEVDSDTDHDGIFLHLFITKKVGRDEGSIRQLMWYEGKKWWQRIAELPDEDESGYPKSASHLFLRSMEHCEKHYPHESVLWMEADCVPMRAGWFQEIEQEYKECGKPFLGALEKGGGNVFHPEHMAGVGVYPPNWRELAPNLAMVLSAPDAPYWGEGKGQAFDCYAGPQIVPQMAVSKTIQQRFGDKYHHDLDSIMSLVKPETALFHQDKQGIMTHMLLYKRQVERYKLQKQ